MAAKHTHKTPHHPVAVYDKSILIGTISLFPLTVDNIDALAEAVATAITEAYEAGVADGAQRVRLDIRTALGL